MANYRRYRVEGGTYFFTVVTRGRRPFLCQPIARQILGDVIRECEERWTFKTDAIVLLPEHLHAIWTLPWGDDWYSARWGWIKKEFSKRWIAAGGRQLPLSKARRERGDLGIWQPRFWEHLIKNEHDFDRHFDYLHYNPVKHGHVRCPREWPHSSFHRWVDHGVYDITWACGLMQPLQFDDLDETAMEF